MSANLSQSNLQPAPEFERRDQSMPSFRDMGRVVSCDGSRVTISAVADDDGSLAQLWSVGRLISISVGENRIVALVFGMQVPKQAWTNTGQNMMLFEAELMGEISASGTGEEAFRAGISAYPHLGAVAHKIRSSDLAILYDLANPDQATIGALSQDQEIDARVSINQMLERHFALLGTTGVGKSTSASLLLRRAIESCPELRVLILDPHNEFEQSLGDLAHVISLDDIDLPFWLFKLEELTEVIYRGTEPIAAEVDVLRDLIPEVKLAYGGEKSSLFKSRGSKQGISVDTPVPYRMADLLKAIDDQLGKLDGKEVRPHAKALKSRLLSVINDPRYSFMFGSNTVNDTIHEILSEIFRIPGHGKPITDFQMSGIPSEVVNSVVSVLCRMAFEIALWSGHANRLLVVCEEAHRYVPADEKLGFVPTKMAISRIAKEGRKYGVSLGVITQRPGELDPTILSQCSTIFAMRLANDRDQDIIRSAIPDCSSSIINFLSSIDNREAIAFGEAITVPMRMRFTTVRADELPKTATALEPAFGTEQTDLRAVVNRMRNLTSDSEGPEEVEDFTTQITDSHGRYQEIGAMDRIYSNRPAQVPEGYSSWPSELSKPTVDQRPPAPATPERMNVQSVRKRLFNK